MHTIEDNPNPQLRAWLIGRFPEAKYWDLTNYHGIEVIKVSIDGILWEGVNLPDELK